MILREKILLGLVGVAAMGAGIVYILPILNPPPVESKRAVVNFPALTVQVQENLKKGASTEREKRVLRAATTDWLRDPLRKRPLVIDTPVEPSAPSPKYVVPLPEYIGFFNIGGQVIAIIDGQDYRAGELIDGGEFTLSQIFPDHVELRRRGASNPVNVPLEKFHPTGKPDIAVSRAVPRATPLAERSPISEESPLTLKPPRILIPPAVLEPEQQLPSQPEQK